jgi:transcriptional repressor NrdR
MAQALAHEVVGPDTLRGVRCPYCKAADDKVVDSRAADEDAAIRRRRECLSCGRRYTTYERVEALPLSVAKRGGQREPFDREKLADGIARATANRPEVDGRAEDIAAAIEAELHALGPEVTSEQVGLAVLEQLKALDPVSYLRFASVYKGFEGIDDFAREVGLLQKATAPKRRRTKSR